MHTQLHLLPPTSHLPLYCLSTRQIHANSKLRSLVSPSAPTTDTTPPRAATSAVTAGSSNSNNHPPGPSCKIYYLVELFACIVDAAK
ncbi:hypothetical protein PISMIDRAFT_17269 [Pisolithus microcarpus 441]|uniref:Uncharacterized protein n=1 Tax=Pisolithus microcarpus 441 TaxID=765257 RepID=A0A0C9XQF6_9AGAM|nr:hypothetical protein PISMIDRAFT_17269 [Pisolithus microcarpus 441]